MTDFYNKGKKLSIYIITLNILTNYMGTFPFGKINEDSGIAKASEWIESSASDFNNGTLDNVVVMPSGIVKLAQDTKFIEDDFTDESKISDKNNVIIDTVSGEAKLIKIIGNYGPCLKMDSAYFEDYNIEQTTDGGYILVGFTDIYGAGYYDAWLVKTDHFGNMQWNKTIGSSEREYVFSFEQTFDGGYIMVGFIESYDSKGNPLKDVWLIKTDSSGNIQWDKIFNKSHREIGRSVQQTSDGGFIIVGDCSQGIWIIKTDNTGNMVWNRSFEGYIGCSIKETVENGYIITGTSLNQSQRDICLIRINNNGNLMWYKTFGGNEDDLGKFVQHTTDGGYIVIGNTESFGAGSSDIWLIKTDSYGNMQWNKTFGGEFRDLSDSVQQTAEGEYIIIGSTESYGVGEFDIWLIKTDNLGNMNWNRTFGEKDDDFGCSVKQTSDEGYIISGSTELSIDRYACLIKTNSSGFIQYTDGELISTNVLSKQNFATINSFNYKAIIPSGTNIKVQFTQNNVNWYDSSGLLNGYNLLKNGFKFIDLSYLGWTGPNFYYKLKFSSNNKNSPSIQKTNISFGEYLDMGSLESQPFDSGGNLTWKNLKWNAIVPTETYIKFQLRSAKNQIDLFSKKYVGPDGNKNTYYFTSGTTLWSGHNNDKWIQYKAFLLTKNTSKSPILNNITLSFNYFPELTSFYVIPIKGNITTIFNFTVSYIDKDNDQPTYIYICINGINITMNESNSKDQLFTNGKRYYYMTKLKAGNHTYQFFTSDGNFNYSTNIENLTVDFGPLHSIIIEPSLVTITMTQYQIFTAKGYDLDNNRLSISPTWEVNGGGIIDYAGNFTPLMPGNWIIYANSSGISGKALIVVEEEDNNTDTDNDSLPNYWERKYGLNLTDPKDAELDFDKDNLTNLEEYLNFTNPFNADTDNDNYNDGLEIDKGTNPLDDNDYPVDDREDGKESNKFDIRPYLFLILIIIILTLLTIYYHFIKKKKIS